MSPALAPLRQSEFTATSLTNHLLLSSPLRRLRHFFPSPIAEFPAGVITYAKPSPFSQWGRGGRAESPDGVFIRGLPRLQPLLRSSSSVRLAQRLWRLWGTRACSSEPPPRPLWEGAAAADACRGLRAGCT